MRLKPWFWPAAASLAAFIAVVLGLVLVDRTGEAAIAGDATFSGVGDQTLRVGAGETLSLGGQTTRKIIGDKLTLEADSIRLTRSDCQTIENQTGQLVIGSENGTGLVKGTFDESGNPVRGILRAEAEERRHELRPFPGETDQADAGEAPPVHGLHAERRRHLALQHFRLHAEVDEHPSLDQAGHDGDAHA